MKRLLLLTFTFCFLNSFSQEKGQALNWAYLLDAYNTTDFADMAIDQKGNVFVAFNYQGEFSIPELKTKLPYSNHLAGGIMKFSKQGKALWVVALTGTRMANIRAVSTAKNGDLLVTGAIDGKGEFGSRGSSPIDFGRAAIQGREYHDPEFLFLSRYNPEGKCLWLCPFTGAWGSGTSIAENSKGELYWSYYFRGKLNYNDTPIDSSLIKHNDNDRYGILKLNAEGKVLTKHPFAYDAFQENPLYNSRLAIDKNDNLIVYGRFKKNLKFGENDSLVSNFSIESVDAFIVKFDADDKFLWSRKIGGQNHQEIRDLRIDDKGKIHATGYYGYECVISNGVSLIQQTQYEYKSGDSFFYCRFSENGELDYANFRKQDGYSSYVMGMSLDIDQSGRTHLIGYYTDTLRNFSSSTSLPGSLHSTASFYSRWNKDNLEVLSRPITPETGWSIPMDIRIKGDLCVIAGIYYGSNKIENVAGKKFPFSEKNYGRSAFIYGFTIPKLPPIQEDRDSTELLADILPVLTCLSPEAMNQENVWVPIDRQIKDTSTITISGCGVIREDISALLVPNPTDGQTKLILKGMTGPALIEIFSESGSFLYAQNIIINQPEQSFDLDFSGVVTGAYFINVVQGNYRKVLTLVKN